MNKYEVAITTRESSFFYEEFKTLSELRILLEELLDDEVSLEDYLSENTEASGWEYQETYSLAIEGEGNEIDRFDPTKAETTFLLTRSSSEKLPDNQSGFKDCRAYIFFHQALKTHISGEFETDNEYDRSRLGIHLSVFEIYRPLREVNDPDTFEHCELTYDGSDIELSSFPAGGQQTIYIAVIDENGEEKELEYDIYEGIPALLSSLSEFS